MSQAINPILESVLGISVPESKNVGQMIWGTALVLAGIGVFYRVPQVMPRIATIEQFAPIQVYIRFCFYFMGVLLIGGGIKKLYANIRKTEDPDAE